jgi:hypothetical protein
MSFVPLALALASTPQLSHWHDGKAEVASYDLTQPRYGEPRKGTAVMIFVTEPFSDSLRVKADPGHDPSDVFPAFKLNFVKDFPTGIYDYNMMTSVFVSMVEKDRRRAGAPVKIAFSAQEWCGMVFDELLLHADRIDRKRFSYFDGEADAEEKLNAPPNAIAVDELPILVRGIPRPFLREGESKRLSVLTSVERARLLHRPLGYVQGTLSRAKATRTVSVSAGKFQVEEWTLELDNGERYTYAVERAFPHRIIEWSGPDGELARMRGVDRIEYWKLNRNGDEKHLSRIGL